MIANQWQFTLDLRLMCANEQETEIVLRMQLEDDYNTLFPVVFFHVLCIICRDRCYYCYFL